jgi:hypothetical protein
MAHVGLKHQAVLMAADVRNHALGRMGTIRTLVELLLGRHTGSTASPAVVMLRAMRCFTHPKSTPIASSMTFLVISPGGEESGKCWCWCVKQGGVRVERQKGRGGRSSAMPGSDPIDSINFYIHPLASVHLHR